MTWLSHIVERLERLRGSADEALRSFQSGSGEEGGKERPLQALLSSRRKLATLALAALAVLLAYRVIFGANGMVVYGEKRSQYRELQIDVERLEKENGELADRNKALQADPEAIEREAREQLRYAKPGEVVVVLPGGEPETPAKDANAGKR